MTSPADLRILDGDELESRLAETQQELFNLRFQRVTGQLDDTARIRQLRREVARMKTILREREIDEAEGLQVEPSARRSPAAAPPEAEAAIAEPGADVEEPDSEEPDSEEPDSEELGEVADGDEEGADSEGGTPEGAR